MHREGGYDENVAGCSACVPEIRMIKSHFVLQRKKHDPNTYPRISLEVLANEYL